MVCKSQAITMQHNYTYVDLKFVTMVHGVGFDYANCNGVYPMDKDRWLLPILEECGYSTSSACSCLTYATFALELESRAQH